MLFTINLKTLNKGSGRVVGKQNQNVLWLLTAEVWEGEGMTVIDVAEVGWVKKLKFVARCCRGGSVGVSTQN